MHNLQLTEDQSMILDTVRKFVQDSVAGRTLEQDEHREFARQGFEGLAELGMFGLPVAESAGGAGMGFLPFAVALQEIAGQNASLARLMLGQVQCALVLQDAATPELLESVITGAVVAVFLGQEHGLIAQDGRLRGTAQLVPGGAEAGVFVAATRLNGAMTLVAVQAAETRREPLASLGLASSGPARVQFEAAAMQHIADGAVAQRALARAELAAHIGSAACCVGIGAAACVAAQKHASERIAFGKPLLAQQAVARKLVEARRRLDGARHLVFHAARLSDLGEKALDTALQARITAAEAAVLAADDAIQIHGGFGYTVEYHVERHYRDAKTIEVLDGGNDRLQATLATLQFEAAR
jgi:butyryl-CoA dehydrogenase